MNVFVWWKYGSLFLLHGYAYVRTTGQISSCPGDKASLRWRSARCQYCSPFSVARQRIGNAKLNWRHFSVTYLDLSLLSSQPSFNAFVRWIPINKISLNRVILVSSLILFYFRWQYGTISLTIPYTDDETCRTSCYRCIDKRDYMSYFISRVADKERLESRSRTMLLVYGFTAGLAIYRRLLVCHWPVSVNEIFFIDLGVDPQVKNPQ